MASDHLSQSKRYDEIRALALQYGSLIGAEKVYVWKDGPKSNPFARIKIHVYDLDITHERGPYHSFHGSPRAVLSELRGAFKVARLMTWKLRNPDVSFNPLHV